jgi:hypothetical protein
VSHSALLFGAVSSSEEESPSDSGDDPFDAPEAPPRRALALRPWERLFAGTIGVSAAGAGGVGVFLSDNQAGTTALLILGVVFLIMAVQGTALRQLNKDGGVYANRDIEERAVKRIERVREEQGPAAAQAALESATAARPELKNSPAVQVMNAHLYEQLLVAYLHKAWLDAFQDSPVLMRMGVEQSFDFVIRLPGIGKPKIGVDVLYTSRDSINPTRIQTAINRHRGSLLPVLIVANRPMSIRVEDDWLEFAKDGRHHFVLWRGPEDYLALEQGIRRLRQAAEEEGQAP